MTREASPAADEQPARRRGMRRRLADDLTALLAIGGLKVLLHLPERLIWTVADLSGAVSYRFSTARRNRARRNLRRVLEWMAANGQGSESNRAAASDPRALEALVRSAFRNHAHYSMELARAPKFTRSWVGERLVVENPEEVEACLVPGKALILIGLHFGAIEVPGIYALQHMGKIVSPMETVANARVQRYLFSTRDTIGIRIVTLEEAGVELLAALRRNEAVGLVADRNLTGNGLEVEMFGSPTKIPAGPILLNAETGAPMYVCAVHRVGPGRYCGGLKQFQPAVGASRRERSRDLLRQEARLFEQFIVEAPEQWLALFHPIWPDLEGSATSRDGDHR